MWNAVTLRKWWRETRHGCGMISFRFSSRCGGRAAESEHAAIREILAFLKRADQRHQKSSAGQLHAHFYSGALPLADFLETTAGEFLRDAYLEVISPYFDDADHCQPLEDLIEKFSPKEVRVFLPRSSSGKHWCGRSSTNP